MFDKINAFVKDANNFVRDSMVDSLQTMELVKNDIPVQFPSATARTIGFVGSVAAYVGVAYGVTKLGIIAGRMAYTAICGKTAN